MTVLVHTLLMTLAWTAAFVIGLRLVDDRDEDDHGDGGTRRPEPEPPFGPPRPDRVELRRAAEDDLARSA